MKKAVIILSLLLFSLSTMAQGPLAYTSAIGHSTLTNPTDSGIVRVWNDTCIISCNNNGVDSSAFLLFPMNLPSLNTPTRSVGLLRHMIVHDFTVFNDYVIFCGSMNNTFGVVGWFDIHDLYLPQVSVNYRYLQKTPAQCFRKVVAYHHNGDIRIAAIGYSDTTVGAILVADRVAEIVLSPTSNQFDLWTLPYGGPFFEDIDDIVVTDSYVALVGKYEDRSVPGSQGLCVRKYGRGQLANGLIDNCYHYPCPIELAFEPKAVAMTGDNISTLNSCYIPSQPAFQLRMYNIDLLSMNMFDAQCHKLLAKNPPYSAVYFPQYKQIVVSYQIDYTDMHHNKAILLVLRPWSTASYQADYMFDPVLQNVTSLTKSMGQYLLGINGVNYFVKDMSIGIHPQGPNCYKNDQLPIDVIVPIIPQKNYQPSNIKSYTIPAVYSIQPVKQNTITPVCTSK